MAFLHFFRFATKNTENNASIFLKQTCVWAFLKHFSRFFQQFLSNGSILFTGLNLSEAARWDESHFCKVVVGILNPEPNRLRHWFLFRQMPTISVIVNTSNYFIFIKLDSINWRVRNHQNGCHQVEFWSALSISNNNKT